MYSNSSENYLILFIVCSTNNQDKNLINIGKIVSRIIESLEFMKNYKFKILLTSNETRILQKKQKFNIKLKNTLLIWNRDYQQ